VLADNQHFRLPPAAPSYQSDEETVHGRILDGLFEVKSFSSRGAFLSTVHNNQFSFSLVRPSSTVFPC